MCSARADRARYKASHFSWVISAPQVDLLDGEDDGIGWSVVQQVIPKDRRDRYFAYLAAPPDGRVPSFPAVVADSVGFKQGSQFCHIEYDFGPRRRAITRPSFHQALNHVLHNPVLPFTPMSPHPGARWGNSYRLSNCKRRSERPRQELRAPTVKPN